MKEFFKWVLILLLTTIGWTGIRLYIQSDDLLFFIIGFNLSLFIGVPAVLFYKEYLDSLFK